MPVFSDATILRTALARSVVTCRPSDLIIVQGNTMAPIFQKNDAQPMPAKP